MRHILEKLNMLFALVAYSCRSIKIARWISVESWVYEKRCWQRIAGQINLRFGAKDSLSFHCIAICVIFYTTSQVNNPSECHYLLSCSVIRALLFLVIFLSLSSINFFLLCFLDSSFLTLDSFHLAPLTHIGRPPNSLLTTGVSFCFLSRTEKTIFFHYSSHVNFVAREIFLSQ